MFCKILLTNVKKPGKMKNIAGLCLVVCLFAFRSATAEPVSLQSAYEKAMSNDARLRAAEADHAIQKEEIGKARAGFRPNIRASASRGRSATESTGMNSSGNAVTQEQYYNTKNYSIQLKQPLFNWTTIAGYKQAKAVVAKSDAVLNVERAGVIVRTAEAYFNAMYAEDNLEFSRVQVQSMAEQLQQARRRYAKGFGTITEVHEAQANHEMAIADALEINNSIEQSRRDLQNIIGVYPDRLQKVLPGKMVLALPEPRDVEKWIALSVDHNSAIEASRQEVLIARKEIEKNRAARYPTIDLYATATNSESDNNYSIGTEYETYTVGLQLNLPIYSGGYVSASVRQSSAKMMKASEQLRQQEQGVSANVRGYYNGVVNSIARIVAYQAAVKSNDLAVIGARKGFVAGVNDAVAIVRAQEKLHLSKRSLAKARYEYLLNRLKLKESAGLLTAGDVEELNGWMNF